MKPVQLFLCVAVLIILCILAYGFISLPFLPPEPSSGLAAVPPIPPSGSQRANAVQSPKTGNEAGTPDSLPSTTSDTDSQLPPDKQTDVETLVREFHSRNTDLPDIDTVDAYGGLRKGLCEIGYAVLTGREPIDTLFKFLDNPDRQVRIDTIEALFDATLALGPSKSLLSLNNLIARLDERQASSVVAAVAEALVRATQAGVETRADYILLSMHERALPALPHLIWTADNHPSPEMRFRTTLFARTLAPHSSATSVLLRRRLSDPNQRVRLLTWRHIIVTSLF